MGVPAIGPRVVVPIGPRMVTGIVIDRGEKTSTAGEIKPVGQLLDAHAFVPPDLVALARWTAEYYVSGIGDTIPLLLPPMARGARVDAHKTVRLASITAAGLEALAADDETTAKQRETLEILAGAPAGIATSVLAAR